MRNFFRAQICVPAPLVATSVLTQNKGPGTEAHFWNPPPPSFAGRPCHPPPAKQFSGRPTTVIAGGTARLLCNESFSEQAATTYKSNPRPRRTVAHLRRMGFLNVCVDLVRDVVRQAYNKAATCPAVAAVCGLRCR